ncbi:MAG: hypothetical protein ABW116_11820 [Candidatus Sedimenticola sp. 20ELBAFRAG]
MSTAKIKKRLSNAFSGLLGISKKRASQLLPSNLTAGKAYEAHVLSVVCEKLKQKEGCSLILKNGSKIVLKTGGGGINRRYPWIEVSKNGNPIGEIFTDIYFTSMSHSLSRTSRSPTPGEFHELDIVMTNYGSSGMPKHDEILIGVECKHTEYKKSLLKEILGVRREMGLLANPLPTVFTKWPSKMVPSNPPSCLLVYSSSSKVNNYSKPGRTYGIEFHHETM